ncbi:hypothetical protein CR513_33658, partial [Mucuna pruriens]
MIDNEFIFAIMKPHCKQSGKYRLFKNVLAHKVIESKKKNGSTYQTKRKNMVKSRSIFLTLEDHDEDKAMYWHKKVDMSNVVREILWTHSNSIKLLNAFHIMLVIDATYKNNKYCLPLLESVGVTSIELTFFMTFAYLEFEQLDNFT